MKRYSKSPLTSSEFTTLRDVVGPGLGMGPCPEQFLGDVVGSYVPASTSRSHALNLRATLSRLTGWFSSATTPSDPTINNSLELFEGLSSAETAAISQLLSVVEISDGRVLGRQGQRCQEFTVVVSGQVAISRDNIAVGLLGPGCWFGCLALLGWNGDKNRLATASALGEVRVAVANAREFAHITENFPVVGDRIFRMAHRRLTYLHELQAEVHALQPVEHHAEYPIHLLDA